MGFYQTKDCDRGVHCEFVQEHFSTNNGKRFITHFNETRSGTVGINNNNNNREPDGRREKCKSNRWSTTGSCKVKGYSCNIVTINHDLKSGLRLYSGEWYTMERGMDVYLRKYYKNSIWLFYFVKYHLHGVLQSHKALGKKTKKTDRS